MSSIACRHSSTTRRAPGGGSSPVSRSRTSIATASSSGASSRSRASAEGLLWKRSSSIAVRLAATPSIRREPIASTRACSTASNSARAGGFCGALRRWIASLWQASRNDIESAMPRRIAASRGFGLRGGSGSRALAPSGPLTRPGLSAENDTSSSGWRDIARAQEVSARLNGSFALSGFCPGFRLWVGLTSTVGIGGLFAGKRSYRTRGRGLTSGLDVRSALCIPSEHAARLLDTCSNRWRLLFFATYRQWESPRSLQRDICNMPQRSSSVAIY